MKKSTGNLIGLKDNVLYISVKCQIHARETKINKFSSQPGLEGKQTPEQTIRAITSVQTEVSICHK